MNAIQEETKKFLDLNKDGKRSGPWPKRLEPVDALGMSRHAWIRRRWVDGFYTDMGYGGKSGYYRHTELNNLYFVVISANRYKSDNRFFLFLVTSGSFTASDRDYNRKAGRLKLQVLQERAVLLGSFKNIASAIEAADVFNP
jgi:hypothetical protein